jgi:hypothetical protein
MLMDEMRAQNYHLGMGLMGLQLGPRFKLGMLILGIYNNLDFSVCAESAYVESGLADNVSQWQERFTADPDLTVSPEEFLNSYRLDLTCMALAYPDPVLSPQRPPISEIAWDLDNIPSLRDLPLAIERSISGIHTSSSLFRQWQFLSTVEIMIDTALTVSDRKRGGGAETWNPEVRAMLGQLGFVQIMQYVNEIRTAHAVPTIDDLVELESIEFPFMDAIGVLDVPD